MLYDVAPETVAQLNVADDEVMFVADNPVVSPHEVCVEETVPLIVKLAICSVPELFFAPKE